MATTTSEPSFDNQKNLAESKDPIQECEKWIRYIDELLDFESLQMKVTDGSDDERKRRDYSLLKAHSDAKIRLHYLMIYANCLKRLLGRAKYPYDPKSTKLRPPIWVLLADGLGTIELMAWSSRFPARVTVESPSFMVYMAVLHDLSTEREQDLDEVDVCASKSEERSVATSTNSLSALFHLGESFKKTDGSRCRFKQLDYLIMDYDRGNRNGADGFQHADWAEVMERFSQISVQGEVDCCSDQPDSVRSRSAQWAISTLEKPFWDAFKSLKSPTAISMVLSHLDSRWPETVGFNNPSLFPASGATHAFIQNSFRRTQGTQRERAPMDESTTASNTKSDVVSYGAPPLRN